MKLQQRPGPGGCHNDGETGEVTGSEVSPNWLVRWSAGPLVRWSAGPRRPRLVIVIRSLKSWQTIRYQTRIFCLVSIRLANQLTMLHLRLNS